MSVAVEVPVPDDPLVRLEAATAEREVLLGQIANLRNAIIELALSSSGWRAHSMRKRARQALAAHQRAGGQ